VKHRLIALCTLLTLAACTDVEPATSDDENTPGETPAGANNSTPDEARPGDPIVLDLDGAPARVDPDVSIAPRAAWVGSTGPWTSHPQHPFRGHFAEGSFRQVAGSADGSRMVAVGVDRLTVVDASDPEGAAVLGDTTLEDEAYDVVVSPDGQLAAVAAGRLLLVDLSDPSSPTVRGRLWEQPVRWVEMSPDGSVVWAASGQTLFTVDITDIDAPVLLGSLRLDDIRGLALNATGTTAYTLGYGGMTVIDVRDPDPVVVAALEQEELLNTYDLVTSPDGDTVFVSTSRYDVAVDVRDPSSPRFMGRVQHGSNWPRDLSMSHDGETLFAVRDNVIDVIDVRDPNALLRRASFEVEQAAAAAPTTNRRWLVVATGAGLMRLDQNNPGSAAPRTAQGVPEDCYRVSDVQLSTDGRAFVAAESLLVFDVADPQAPTMTGRHAANVTKLAISADGQAIFGAQTIFGAGSGDALRTFDVTGAEPVELSLFDQPTAQPMDLAPSRDGQTLFMVTEGGGGLDVMDTSNLAAPTRVAHFYVRHTESIVLSPDETVVYIADPYENGLLAVDVTTPAEPGFLGRLPLAVGQLAQCSDGQTLLAGGRSAGLYVIDTADPAAMHVVGEVEMYQPVDLVVSPDCTTAYVTDGFALRIVDLTRRDAPAIIGMFEVRGAPTGVALSPDGNMAAVVSDHSDACLGLLDIEPPTLQQRRPTQAGVQRFGFAWPEHYAQHPESLVWRASAGSVVISEIDQRNNTATIDWAVPADARDAVLEIAVGNHQYYQVATVLGGF
jgi:hypothetical protein